MLSIGAVGSSGQGEYYLALAREDYYLEGGEPLGRWHGVGAAALGLTATVESAVFRNLLRGFAPEGAHSLIQNAGDQDHQPGWDLTFSAPKSVSVLWSQADGETRQKIQAAHHASVGVALDYLQGEAAFTRRGKGGQEREEAGLVVATFEHGTSRAQDPQLHTHAVVLNVGTRTDGTTGTVESKPLYQHKMAAGAVYRAEFAHQLEQTLHLATEREKSWFELPCVPKALVEAFSTRRQDILAALDARGIGTAKAAAVAALATRQTKEHTARDVLTERWQEVGKVHGFGPRDVQTLLQSFPHTPQKDWKAALPSILEQATNHLLYNNSSFSRTEFVRAVAEEAQGKGIGAMALLPAAKEHLAHNPEIVALGASGGEARYTIREFLTLEAALLKRVGQSQENDQHTAQPENYTRVILMRPLLSEEQAKALHHITARTGSVQVVSGFAGTGKTVLLEAAKEVWEREGFTVLGAALAGKAAEGLQEGADIPSRTLHSTLSRIENGSLLLDGRTVLVVDEAAMVGTRQMAALVEATEKAGTKLVLVGDARQLQPIEAGGAFGAIGERIGQAELTDVKRQREEWARDAVVNIAEGGGRKTLRAFAEQGCLHVADNRQEAMNALVHHWKEYGVSGANDCLIIAGLNAEATYLNRLAQRERLEAGVLGKTSLPIGDAQIYEGDRILFKQNSGVYGVRNGHFATVSHLNEARRTLTATLDTGEQVTIPLECYTHIRLGYAATTHAAQGTTVEKAFVLFGGAMQDRELSYVQVSRARGETHLYTDRSEAGDVFTDLARQMETSHQKELAVSLMERNHSQDLTL